MRVYIIDNYDSFTYNLYQFIGEIFSEAKSAGKLENFDIVVKRNDQVTLEEIQAYQPDRIIISPGPGSPDDPEYFGVCAAVIKELGPKIPLLGVCLGMQGIVHVFGGEIVKAEIPMHGKMSPIYHDGKAVFKNIPNELEVMRYHSLVAAPEQLPACLRITSVVTESPITHFEQFDIKDHKQMEIMGIQHKEHPIYGIQFHPESFATEGGKEMLSNFFFSI